MSEPNKPDPGEYFRTVLYNLAALTAEVREVKYLLCDALADSKHLPAEQIRHHYDQTVKEETERLYRVYLDTTRIPPAD